MYINYVINSTSIIPPINNHSSHSPDQLSISSATLTAQPVDATSLWCHKCQKWSQAPQWSFPRPPSLVEQAEPRSLTRTHQERWLARSRKIPPEKFKSYFVKLIHQKTETTWSSFVGLDSNRRPEAYRRYWLKKVATSHIFRYNVTVTSIEHYEDKHLMILLWRHINQLLAVCISSQNGTYALQCDVDMTHFPRSY